MGCNPRPSGTGWAARCPAHDDRTPSLSLHVGGDGRALLECHAGCETGAIVAALGQNMAELLSLSERAIWRLIARRELKVVRFGRATRVRMDSIEAIVERGGAA